MRTRARLDFESRPSYTLVIFVEDGSQRVRWQHRRHQPLSAVMLLSAVFCCCSSRLCLLFLCCCSRFCLLFVCCCFRFDTSVTVKQQHQQYNFLFYCQVTSKSHKEAMLELLLAHYYYYWLMDGCLTGPWFVGRFAAHLYVYLLDGPEKRRYYTDWIICGTERWFIFNGQSTMTVKSGRRVVDQLIDFQKLA